MFIRSDAVMSELLHSLAIATIKCHIIRITLDTSCNSAEKTCNCTVLAIAIIHIATLYMIMISYKSAIDNYIL